MDNCRKCGGLRYIDSKVCLLSSRSISSDLSIFSIEA
jgi:hypothetical protein